MSQFAFDADGEDSGDDLVSQLDSMYSALKSLHSGSSRPSYAEAGTLWLDTTADPRLLKLYDGADDIIVGYLHAASNLFMLGAGVRLVDTSDTTKRMIFNVANITGGATRELVMADKTIDLRHLQKGSNVASAATITLDRGNFFHITGTTTITDIDFTDAFDGRWAMLEFDGALTLTHNATTLVLPGGANIGTAAGDTCIVVQDSSDNVHVCAYQRAVAAPLFYATQATMVSGASLVQAVSPGRQHFHPLMPKFVCRFNGTGTPAVVTSAGITISSITDHGAGDWTLNLASSFSDANWIPEVSLGPTNSSGLRDVTVSVFDMAAGSVRINAYDHSAAALADVPAITVKGYGTLA